MKSILDFDLKGKTVLIRCDLNVTLVDGKILDDTRITSSIKSIKYILDNGGKAIILSHFGKVKTTEDKEKYSLRIVYDRLKELIPNLSFCDSLDFDTIGDFVGKVDFGKAVLLENTRFYDLDGKLESDCSEKLYKFYASLGDIFILDAFGSLHRAHASTLGISNILPTGIGFLVIDELKNLDVLFHPEHPFAVIMGGAKVSDKISVINSFIDQVDTLLVGGAMANTFLKAKGYDLGISIYEEEMLDTCKSLLKRYGDKIVLPVDFYGNLSYENGEAKYTELDSFDSSLMALDIGPKTVELFSSKLANIKTVFWNGPLGVTDFSNFSYGTKSILAVISNISCTSILGGGDVVAAVKNLGFSDKVTFLSTGGGATLTYLADKDLISLKNIER